LDLDWGQPYPCPAQAQPLPTQPGVLSPLPIDLQSLTVISHDALPLPDGRAASPPQHPGRFAFLSSHPPLWRWYVVWADGGGSAAAGTAAANSGGLGARGRQRQTRRATADEGGLRVAPDVRVRLDVRALAPPTFRNDQI